MSTISGFLSEKVDPSKGEKSFYDLKAALPGSKEYDFVRPLYCMYSTEIVSNDSPLCRERQC